MKKIQRDNTAAYKNIQQINSAVYRTSNRIVQLYLAIFDLLSKYKCINPGEQYIYTNFKYNKAIEGTFNRLYES